MNIVFAVVAFTALPLSNAWNFHYPGIVPRNNDVSFGSRCQRQRKSTTAFMAEDPEMDANDTNPSPTEGYDLGLGKNKPVVSGSGGDTPTLKYELGSGVNSPIGDKNENIVPKDLHWHAPQPVVKPEGGYVANEVREDGKSEKDDENNGSISIGPLTTRKRMVARNDEGQMLRGALWDEDHFDESSNELDLSNGAELEVIDDECGSPGFPQPELFYPDIDLSIPESIFSDKKDVVWDLMRWEANQEAQREPLLVSFLHSTILNHKSLESSLAFMLANRLSSAAMISTQVQSLILEAFLIDPSISRAVRADIMAVRDRDPACTCLPDVFLYFKGFHALQTYRVAHALYRAGRRQTSAYLQSQMSQTFQIDIHPNATLGRGIMLDHGTGIVIGETAEVGHNCSLLHHVTLGGSGKRGIDRHPKVGNGVLLGAGASIIGSVRLGEGCQVGAGTLVITDLPPHSVAVGVPAKIIGSFIDVSEQPSIGMDQTMNEQKIITFQSDGI